MEYKTGWCVTLYSDESQEANDNRDKAHFLSWSPYDRVQITSSNEFNNFIFPNVSNIVEWCGVKQQLHLVPLESISPYSKNKVEEYASLDWQIGEENNPCVLIRNVKSKDYGLYCFVTARFSDIIIRSISNVKDSKLSHKIRHGIIHDILQHINAYVNSRCLDVECVSFESLGSEDFALIFLADDVASFSQVLSIVRSQVIKNINTEEDIDVCKSICTLVGFNKEAFNSDPKLDALIKINVNKLCDIDKVKREFERVISNKIDSCVLFQNKGVMEIRFRPNNLELWHEGGLLNGTSDFYKNTIISSRTYWVEDIFQDDNVTSKHIPNEIKEINIQILNQKKLIEIKDEIKKKRKISNDKMYSIDNPVGRFIFSEYSRLLCLTRCTEWIDILQEQRKTFCDCIQFFENQYNKRRYQEGLNHLLEEIQTVLTHINQACAQISEIPYHNHYYSGSFSNILKMYYGIISTIIEIGYCIPREEKNEQSKLTFGVKFETTNRIYTTLYSVPNHTSRIAIFHLPYDAFYEFDKTIILLVHEVFHYIAPINRNYRNNCIIKIWTSYICNEFELYIYKNSKNNKKIFDLLDSILRSKIDDISENVFEEIMCVLPKLSNLELSDFSSSNYNSNFVILVFMHILSSIRSYLEFDIDKNTINSKNKVKQQVYIELKDLCRYFIDDLSENDSNETFLGWFINKDRELIGRLESQANAVKEAFCDLFMCKIFGLGFNEYLKIFTKFEGNVIKKTENDLTLIYRVNIVGYYLEGEYPLWEKETIKDFDSNEEKTFYETLKNKSFKLRNELYWNNLIQAIKLENDFLISLDDFSNEHIKKLINDLKMGYDLNGNDFSNHMNIIHQFDNKSLPAKRKNSQNLNKPHTKNKSFSTNIYLDDIVFVNSVSTYIECICNMALKNDENNQEWWFRGICSDKFQLLPSLFRFSDDSLSLYANQVNILKQAYASTLQFPEYWEGDIAEHMCWLQHYGMPTNLLDFSLDMLVALHFAVNPDVESDRNAVTTGKLYPVVVVFKPSEYNRAINCLKDEMVDIDYDCYKNISPVLYNIAQDNLSGFFPKNTDALSLIDHTRQYNIGYTSSRRTDLYPVPIIIRRNNSRILSQNGTFVAFNLDSKPLSDSIGQDRYKYLDLYQIQYDYSKLLEKNNIPVRRFIEVIHIAPSAISSIRSDLKTLGISTAKMYPELKYIFEEAKEKYRKKIGK